MTDSRPSLFVTESMNPYLGLVRAAFAVLSVVASAPSCSPSQGGGGPESADGAPEASVLDAGSADEAPVRSDADDPDGYLVVTDSTSRDAAGFDAPFDADADPEDCGPCCSAISPSTAAFTEGRCKVS